MIALTAAPRQSPPFDAQGDPSPAAEGVLPPLAEGMMPRRPVLSRRVASISHPSARALPFALPPTTLPRPHLASASQSRTLTALPAVPPTRWGRHLPWAERMLPAVGALPGLYNGLQEARQALGWRATLLQRRSLCAARGAVIGRALSAGQAQGPKRWAGVLALRQDALAREGAALDEALRQARYRLINGLLEWAALVCTAVPQLHGALGLTAYGSLLRMLKRGVPACLIFSALVGIAENMGTWWKLPPGPASQRERYRCISHLIAWSLFGLGLTAAAAPLASGAVAPWLGSALLASAITALSGHHVWQGDAYVASRTGWEHAAWLSQAFGVPNQPAALRELYQQARQHYCTVLDGLTAQVTAPRAHLLRLFGRFEALPARRLIFNACVRQWLSPRPSHAGARLHRALVQHNQALQAHWAEHAWRAHTHQAAAEAALALLDAEGPQPAGLTAGVQLAAQLAQADVQAVATEAHKAAAYLRALQGVPHDEGLARLAAHHGLPPAAPEAQLAPVLMHWASELFEANDALRFFERSQLMRA